MQSKLESLVETKAGGVISLRTAWKHALSASVNAGLSEAAVAELISRFRHPASLIKLCESIPASDEGLSASAMWEYLQTLSLDSIFDRDDWLEALEAVLQYLIRSGRSASAKTMLGYLSCSAEAAASMPGKADFRRAVETFLQEFGFEG